ncbi:hypothetical protein DI392_00005, partial [Vibrio albus]
MNVVLANVAGSSKFIAIDINGNLKFIDNPSELAPGEVIVNAGGHEVTTDLGSMVGVANRSGGIDAIGNNELDQLFAALEGGQDPTALEDLAPAAGGPQGSAPTTSGTIDRDGTSTIASTFYDTTGIDTLGLPETQALSLLNVVAQVAATFSGDDQGEVVEDESNLTLTETGSLIVTDPDEGQAAFVPDAVTASEGALGALTITENGDWVYEVDNDLEAIQALGEGDTRQETFTVESIDGSQHDITITIVGTNDVAVIFGDDQGVVTEDASDPILTDSGILTVTDVDEGEAFFVPESVRASAGALGSLTIDAAGNWVYEVDNGLDEIQSLGEGDTRQETFTVESIDGTQHDITITITGSNDGATIIPAPDDPDDPNYYEQDTNTIEVGIDAQGNPIGDPNASGRLLVSDVDTGEALFQTPAADDLVGTYGSFTFDASTGEWTYVLDEAKSDLLNAGDEVTDTLTVTSYDGTATEDIVVNILGSNDGATITPVDPQDVNTVEPGDEVLGDLSAGGKLDVTDPDEGESLFTVPADLDGTYGSFTFDENGNWTYTLDPDKADVLTDGQEVTETLTVSSVDGTASYDIEVDVLGSNDGATIIPAPDDDPDDPNYYEQDMNTIEVGIDAQGNPIGDPNASGRLLVSDVDTGEALFQTPAADDLVGTYGSFTFDASTGEWTYVLDEAKSDLLNAGDEVTDTLTVTSYDGTATEDIVVNILGSNDGATITPVDPQDVNTVEPGDEVLGDLSAGGKLDVTDPDEGESLFTVPADLDGTYGSFTFDENGNWTYTLDPDKADVLTDGQEVTETLTVSSVDGTASYDIEVDVLGSNDGAVVSGDDSGAVTEDASDPTLTDSGILTVTDADEGEAVFVPGSVVASVGALGSLTIDAAGNWVYNVANSDVQYLGDGDTKQEVFTVATEDGTEHDITITITGVNDGAVVSGDDSGAVTEDASDPTLTDSGILTVTDA